MDVPLGEQCASEISTPFVPCAVNYAHSVLGSLVCFAEIGMLWRSIGFLAVGGAQFWEVEIEKTVTHRGELSRT